MGDKTRRWQPTAKGLKGRLVAALNSATSSCRPPSRSSVTEEELYLQLCTRAAADPEVFRRFRRDPAYIRTLEHVTEGQGAEYLRLIQEQSPQRLYEYLDYGRRNDEFGSPVMFSYPVSGTISPVTLRYLKVLSDLERYFGDLGRKRIVEIGIGYGGQCALVRRRWPDCEYVLIDLAPPLALAQRFLTAAGVASGVEFVDPRELTTGRYDLLISNYSFSELSRNTQETYRSVVVEHSARGYLTCNFISGSHGIESWSMDELEQMHPGAHWVPEEPLTHPHNRVLLWGDHVQLSEDATQRREAMYP